VEDDKRTPAPRYDVTWRARLKCTEWITVMRVATANLSRGGAFFASTTPPRLGTPLLIELELPDHSTMSLRGECVHVRTAAEARLQGRRPGFGVRFEQSHAVDLMLLEEMAKAAGASPDEVPASPAAGEAPAVAAPGASAVSAPGASASAAPSASGQGPRTIHGLSPMALAEALGEKSARSAGPPAIGVDFGTTYTRIAAFADGKVELLADDEGHLVIPSVVSWPEEGGTLVGWAARMRLAEDPSHTVASVKRLLGRRYDDHAIQGYLAQTGLATERGPNDQILIAIGQQSVAVPQVCAMIVRYACEQAEKRLGERVRRAVFSMPVTFGPGEQSALRRVAQIAGVEMLALIEEPMAAALAYDYGKSANEVIAVYDFGGGTFDFTVLDVSHQRFRVMATRGDAWLGGDDFDLALAQYAADRFWRETGVELRSRAVEWQRLLLAAEEAKRQLTVTESAVIDVPQAILSPRPTDLRVPLDRSTLTELCGPLVTRSVEVCQEALEAAGLAPRDVSRVVLAGGTTHVPLVREVVGQYFEREIDTVVSPDAAVAEGTAIHASRLMADNHGT
jgi:molecular chaperone DnaK